MLCITFTLWFLCPVLAKIGKCRVITDPATFLAETRLTLPPIGGPYTTSAQTKPNFNVKKT